MFDINKVYSPKTVEEALALLFQKEDAMVISGGTDVLIKVREHKITNPVLISIHEMEELKRITRDCNGSIIIGPCASFSQITNDPVINSWIPVLAKAADTVGGPQIRNAGTIGGNICNGVTSADTATSLLCLNARLELRSYSETREVSIHDFYLGPGKTVRKREELLTKIIIPASEYDSFYGEYLKYGKREAMEIATLSCAVLVKLTEDKRKLAKVRMAFGVAAPVPMRVFKTEEKLKGSEITIELFDKVKRLVLSEIIPRDSWRAAKEFREMIACEMAVRALETAIQRAGGKIE